MSLGWWDVTSAFTKKTDDDTFPFFRTELRWREVMGVAQLSHASEAIYYMSRADPRRLDCYKRCCMRHLTLLPN